ncbi:hypothetical protein GW17_00002522 [Ensete ventricosum]|nr:hypothetical protein GW17_00002522 [Ensete ventricosum]
MMPGRRCFTREPPQILIGKRRPNHTRGRTPHVGGLWPRRVISAPLSLGGARSPVRPRHPAPPPAVVQGHEESVEDFVRRNLGDEVFERLIEPFCSGVYAGDPAKLSMKAAFGKVWKLEQNGGIKCWPSCRRLPKPKGQTVASFRKGLAMLPDAISSRLGNKVKLSWKLTSIRKLDGQGYILMYETPEGLTSVQTRSVVLTIPSYITSNLLRPLSYFILIGDAFQNDAADALSKFYYPPVAAVSISYPKEAIRKECLIDGELKGFGQLHPRSQGVETLGIVLFLISLRYS